MDIADTRKCNVWNLKRLADFFGADQAILESYYQEILEDVSFLQEINNRLKTVRQEFGFTKGIFNRESVDSADWFAFERVLLYVLVRHFRPRAVLETGVYYGGNTAFLLAALERNGLGKLVSIDLPDSTIRTTQEGTAARHPLVGETEFYEPKMKPGFIVPEYLKKHWEFVEGDSISTIPTRAEKFDLYLHDSDHSMDFLTAEAEAAWPKLAQDAVVVVDDIDWSNGFFALCVSKKLCPVLFTDNGKDNLRVRTGLVKLDHPRNLDPAFVG
ncbi:class I SAM-dependent methyltransferase [Reyranella sp.]|uniref:class I SAM-dependent methyltransferase n=1 Tax=Reyranella sp. TaxID=1929291 RepID=UPI003F72D5DD